MPIKFVHNVLALLLFINIVHNAFGDICELCVCTQSEDLRSIECNGKREIDNYTEIFDLLAFNDYDSVRKLVLTKHEITSLPLDAFRRLQKLKSLDLSENSITDLESDIFKDLQSLEELNFSFNRLTSLTGDVFNNIQYLLKLNLSNNQIANINDTSANQLPKLTHLDLSHNHLETIDNKFIESLSNLQFLDVSFNKINKLPEEFLSRFGSLSELRVTNNLLQSISGEDLPSSLRALSIGNNKIASLPLNLPEIRYLNIQDNSISSIQIAAAWFKELQSLNISGNAITAFPDVKFNSLKILDLSRNKLQSIPETLKTNNFPVVETLVIGSNPIKNVIFTSELRLRSLFLNNLDLMETIESNAFHNLKGVNGECINVTISENPRLHLIENGTLNGTDICALDLSRNAITRISPEVIKSEGKFVLDKGIDLQGNPLTCDCDSQWMLNDLVPYLYTVNPELLEDLRCGAPLELSGLRIVHWMKWKNQVFCDTSPQILSKMSLDPSAVLASKKATIKLESSREMLGIVAGAMGTLCILIIVGILIARKVDLRRRRINRRF